MHNRILITAAGSIGERHIRNLWQLGYRDLVVFRTRNLPFRDIGDAKVKVILSWEEALKSGAEMAFITSPTHLHSQQTIDCLRANMHVFVEKPIAHDVNQQSDLLTLARQYEKVVQVGYMMRFHPLVAEMKRLCVEKNLGELLLAESYWGEYLPHWHPWEDYRTSYAALAEMGGGAALTLSHEIDLILWLVNQSPTKYFTLKNTLKTLPIAADNVTEVLMQFGQQTVARVHVNYIEKKPKRRTELLFENGRASFSYFDNSLLVEDFKTNTSQTKTCPDFDRNDMFISETKHFFEQIKNGLFGVTDDLERAFDVVKMCTNNE